MLRRFVLAAVLAASVAGPSMAQDCDTRFTLRNSSGATVNEFYFGPSSRPDWGRDRLGENVVPPGRAVNYTPGGRGGSYDFKIVWANGDKAELMRVNICETAEIVATRSGIEAR